MNRMIGLIYEWGLVVYKGTVAYCYEVVMLPTICLKRLIEPRMQFILGCVSSITNWNQVRQSFVSGCCLYSDTSANE
jgi:hypothetical protein